MKERIFMGIGVSPGIAIGKAYVLEMAKPVIWMHRIQPDEIDSEIERFNRALTETKSSLIEIKGKIGEEMGSNHAYIFDAHLLMLEDQILVDGTISHIREKRVNAEYALQQVTNGLSKTFNSFEDAYLRERGVDVLDVSNRVQWHLCRPLGTSQSAPEEPSIMLAHDIHPSKLASMDTSNVLGIAMDVGGQTTHTGLLASAKNIPSVVGLRDISVIVRQDETIIVDGSDGKVIISPEEKTLRAYEQKLQLFQQREEELIQMRDLPSVTTDGLEIKLYANIELKEELDPAFNKYGAQGVGLYRSEFIYLSNPDVIPTEKEHEEMYTAMAESLHDKFIYLRTLDLGGEKQLESLNMAPETNPAMGLRAIRFSLRNKSLLKAQIRGALRASTKGDIRIMIPMVSGIGEFRQVKTILEECQTDLMKEGIPVNEDIELGITIEVPSAAAIADILAEEADFISVGTNDLIQYILAIDRGNEAVAYLYEPLHPAVLRTLADIAKKVNAAGKPLSMCGEMAADPIALPLLIGMGYRGFSMNPLSIPVIKSIVRAVSASLCKDIAEQALEMKSVRELYKFMQGKLEQYYPELKLLNLGLPLGEI